MAIQSKPVSLATAPVLTAKRDVSATPKTSTAAAHEQQALQAIAPGPSNREAIEERRDGFRNFLGQFDRPVSIDAGEQRRRDRLILSSTPVDEMSPTRQKNFNAALTADLVDAFKREPIFAVFSKFISGDADLVSAHNALKVQENSRPDTPVGIGDTWFQTRFDKCVSRLETARSDWRPDVVPDELNMALNNSFGLDAFSAWADDRNVGLHQPLAQALIGHLEARIEWLEAKTARAAVDAPSIRLPYGQQLHGIDSADLARFVALPEVLVEFGWLRDLAATHEPETVALGKRFMTALNAARDVVAADG